MSKYNIKELQAQINEQVKVAKATKVDTSDWGEFKLSDYFNFNASPSITISKAKEVGGDNILVSSSGKNNGIVGMTGVDFTHEGNCLSIGSAGNSMITHYRAEPFVLSLNTLVAEPKEDFLNEYTARFLKTILELYRVKYNYSYKITLGRFADFTIKLPALNGEPDWEYMENFIKNLE